MAHRVVREVVEVLQLLGEAQRVGGELRVALGLDGHATTVLVVVDEDVRPIGSDNGCVDVPLAVGVEHGDSLLNDERGTRVFLDLVLHERRVAAHAVEHLEVSVGGDDGGGE